MQIATPGPEGKAAFQGDANGRALQPFALAPQPPRTEAAGAPSRQRLPSALPLPWSPLQSSPGPPPCAKGGQRCGTGAGAQEEGGGRRRAAPSPPRLGRGVGGTQSRSPGGCWDLEEGPAADEGRDAGRHAGRRRWLRGRGGGRAAHAWPRRALRPPPATRGLQTRRSCSSSSSSARSIQARKSGSLTEPAFPLTQPQPRLILSTEGKEAN